MKRKYVTPETKMLRVQTEGTILAGSVDQQVLVEKEFNIYTDSYEDKSFDWDSRSFE